MTIEEGREQAILGLAEMMRSTHFTVEFKVKKKPAGIKVVIELTQDQMDDIMTKTGKGYGNESCDT